MTSFGCTHSDNIYLDNAASAPILPEVVDAIMPYLTNKWYNPSAKYKEGRDIRKDINKARQEISRFINAFEDEIYFTSGATESNNWVIRGFDDKYRKEPDKYSYILKSSIEHSSIESAFENPTIHSKKFQIPVNKEGFIDYSYLENILLNMNGDNILVSICFANNEIGTIQDIKKISSLVHKYNGIFHTDATQAFGRIPIDVKDLGIDLLSASAQKIGGLKGTGILYMKRGIDLPPLLYGTQENNKRGGTENVIGIIAMKKAVEVAAKNMRQNNIKVREMCGYLLDSLKKQNITYKLNGSIKNRLANNLSLTFDLGLLGESLMYLLDCSGILVSSGSACTPASVKSSHVLEAIGLDENDALKTIRITLSDSITSQDIDKFIAELIKISQMHKINENIFKKEYTAIFGKAEKENDV